MQLAPVTEKFILHWGEMGSRWGVNRTVAQIHALLYLSARPLHAGEIAQTLAVARSNVSTSLKELQGWGIIRVVHVLGDRRDHFESMKDVWEMFQQVLDERKRREIDPTVTLLRECLAELNGQRRSAGDDETQRRLRDLLDFFETMTVWYAQIRSLPALMLRRFVRMGGKVQKLLGVG